MAQSNILSNLSRYSFETYAPGILGTNFKGVKILSCSVYSIITGYDLDTIHRQIYPSLPPGTPDDPTAFNYYHIEFPNGDRTVIAHEWIRDSTIVKQDNVAITVKIVNDVTQKDAEAIRNLLAMNNYQVEIQVKAI